MEYRLHMGPWNSVFAVPTALVDRYLKLAGKEQLQVLLWICLLYTSPSPRDCS